MRGVAVCRRPGIDSCVFDADFVRLLLLRVGSKKFCSHGLDADLEEKTPFAVHFRGPNDSHAYSQGLRMPTDAAWAG